MRKAPHEGSVKGFEDLEDLGAHSLREGIMPLRKLGSKDFRFRRGSVHKPMKGSEAGTLVEFAEPTPPPGSLEPEPEGAYVLLSHRNIIRRASNQDAKQLEQS